MRRRMIQAFIATLLVTTLAVTPVFASSLEDMQADKAEAESEASSLQEQLTQTLDKIDTLQTDMASKEEEVEQAGQDLEEAAAKQSEQYEAMKLRIKYMYEEGDTSFLEALFSATSFSDLINKAEYVQEVHSYDRTKLNEYEETTKQVETLKEGLDEEYEQLQTMQTELESEKASLSATLDEKQSEIAQLDQSIQDKLAAIQEEERKAQEEAARAAAEAEATVTTTQGGTSNGGNTGGGNSGGNSGGGSGNGSSGNGSSGNGSSYVPPQGTDGWAVVAYARQFLGNPYVLGGNSLTNGIDCSGFTQQIYAAFGVSLPRVDSAQATCGVEIPLSQAQAGDLLCYYGHVGIYNGTGGIIHASSPEVGIVEFPSCQYRTLKCVRRVL